MRTGDTGKDHLGVVAAGAGCAGQHQHQGKRRQSTDEGAAGHAQCQAAEAQQADQHRAGRGTGRQPQQVRLGQRVAQQCLEDHAAGGQAGAAGCGDQGAGQAVVPDDAGVDRVDWVAGLPQVVGQHLAYHAGRQVALADGGTGQQGHQQGRQGNGDAG
ncbi:hypothetical protein D9M71_555140 [compost metagenome]